VSRRRGSPPAPTDDRVTDILRGGQAIADYLGLPYSTAYRLIESKRIPAGKLGDLLIGSKRRIAEALDKIASGE
jgi:excisionase family DNA binding protein